ncbi:hypothetical protein IAU60_001397 [Kwoniella sp. DSM 27419]
MRHPDYPFWASAALIIVALPAPWHFRARNIATLSLILWLTLANLCTFVNTIIWKDNYDDCNPIWCDISSRILLLLNFALPACSLAQMRRLETVASCRRTSLSPRDKKRRTIEEVVVCLVSPALLVALFVLVQGHRYDIVENIGCVTSTYMSVPALIIRFIVPMVAAIASLVYAVLAVRWFLIRRLQFQTVLTSSNSNLSISRYLRLIALAVIDSSILLAYSIYNFTSANDSSIKPYVSWAFVHDRYSHIAQYPEELIGPTYPVFVANIYLPITYAIVFFTFFGFGEEAISEYIRVWRWIFSSVSTCTSRRLRHDNVAVPAHFTLGSKVVAASEDDPAREIKVSDVRSENPPSDQQDYHSHHQGSTRNGVFEVEVTIEQSKV